MGFLSGLSNIFHGIGHVLGIGDDGEEERKRQQEQQAAPQAAPVRVNVPQTNNPVDFAQTLEKTSPLDIGSQLIQSGSPTGPVKPPAPTTIAPNTLVKAPMSPAQQRSASWLAANGGNNPDYQSKPVSGFDVAQEATKGIYHTLADPAIQNYQEEQKAEAQHRAAAAPGIIGNLKATAQDVGSMAKAMGKTGLEYAAYAAPEIRGIRAAAEAPLLIKAGAGLVAHGATSAPLSVAGSLASGETDPVKIAENAAVQSLLAGTVPALKGISKELAPGVKSANPDQALHAAQQIQEAAGLSKADPSAPTNLDVPAYQRQGLPEPVRESLDTPTFERNGIPGIDMQKAAQDAHDLAIAQASQAGSPLDVPTFMRNQLALPEPAPRDNLAVPIDPNSPEGGVLLNANKPQLVPGMPDVPGKNVTDIGAPRVAVNPEVLQKARDLAIAKATGAENVVPHTPSPISEPIDALMKRIENPTGKSDTEVVKAINDVIGHPDATAGDKEWAIAQRDKLTAGAPRPAEPTVPEMAAPNTPVLPENTPVRAATPVEEAPAPKVQKTAQSDLPEANLGGTAKTGETGSSAGKFSKGQEYEKSSVEASRARGESEAGKVSYEDFTKKIEDNKGMSGADRDTAIAMQKRFPVGSAEHRQLGDLVNKYHTEAAQTLATAEREARATDNPKTISDRFANKLYKNLDDAKIDDKTFESIQKKNEAFVTARDARDSAYDTFLHDPSDANLKEFVKSFDALDEADRAAHFEEYKVAHEAAKDSKNPQAAQFVEKLKKDANVYQMDWVDSSLLSSTRVMLNNFLNTVGVRGEEAAFGKAGARVAKLLTGETIGGGNRAGAKLGAQLGNKALVAEAKLRQTAPGNTLVKSLKNYTTTGNTLGESNIMATAYSGILDHYKQDLKAQGFKGDELDRRAVVSSLMDPDHISQTYMGSALANNALSPTFTGKDGQKLETWLANSISSKMGDSAAAKNLAKAVVRVTVGFPTVIGRSALQGAKRTLVGVPSAIQAASNAIKGGPPEVTALHIKNAVKEAGSGATMMSLGFALGSAGIISGSYPTDKDEQAAWKRENKTDNSIKIDGNWYNLPSALGVFALPFLLGANAGSNTANGEPASKDWAKTTIATIINSTPTDTILKSLKSLKDLEDGKNIDDYLASSGSSIVRAETPLGSLVNEFGKMFDPYTNDTTKGDLLTQFLAKVQDGMPGATNFLPDKTVGGNKVENPGIIPRLLGASYKEQSAGVQESSEIQNEVDAQTQALKDNGVFNDKIKGLLDEEGTNAYEKAQSGEKLDPSEIKKLNQEITKNVDKTSDTRFLEDGDYDNNLTVLKTKRAMLAADPTTREAELKDYDTQIKRGQLYKDNKIPYDLISKYAKVSLSEWRDLGDPKSDTYNPDLYQKLYDIDNTLTAGSVSRNNEDPSKNKYSAKSAGKGRGGGRGGSTAGGGISNLTPLSKITFGNLAPEKVSSTTKIPTVATVKPGELIKKRAISVSKAR